jgi:hypothetical protein
MKTKYKALFFGLFLIHCQKSKVNGLSNPQEETRMARNLPSYSGFNQEVYFRDTHNLDEATVAFIDLKTPQGTLLNKCYDVYVTPVHDPSKRRSNFPDNRACFYNGFATLGVALSPYFASNQEGYFQMRFEFVEGGFSIVAEKTLDLILKNKNVLELAVDLYAESNGTYIGEFYNADAKNLIIPMKYTINGTVAIINTQFDEQGYATTPVTKTMAETNKPVYFFYTNAQGKFVLGKKGVGEIPIDVPCLRDDMAILADMGLNAKSLGVKIDANNKVTTLVVSACGNCIGISRFSKMEKDSLLDNLEYTDNFVALKQIRIPSVIFFNEIMPSDFFGIRIEDPALVALGESLNIKILPRDFGCLAKLTKLSLHGLTIETLPRSFYKLNLGLMNISYTQLHTIPNNLFFMKIGIIITAGMPFPGKVSLWNNFNLSKAEVEKFQSFPISKGAYISPIPAN